MFEAVMNFLKNETVLAALTWLSSIGAISVLVGLVLHNLKTIKFRVRLSRELEREGIRNFYPDAQTYMEHKDHGKPAQYMRRANRKIAYVGFWLSHSVGLGGIVDTVRDLLAKGTEVTFVLMNPYSRNISNYCKAFFGFDKNYIESEFIRALRPLYDFYASPSLSPNDKKRFRILLHNMPISAAAFLIDWDDDNNGRILLDSKIMGVEFSDGFGLELLANTKNRSSLSMYNRLKKSYLAFLEPNKTIPTDTFEVLLDGKTFDDVVSSIKSKYE